MAVGTVREYNYVNSMGYRKTIKVTKRSDGKNNFEIWSRDTGDLCSTGQVSEEELDDFLSNYCYTQVR